MKTAVIDIGSNSVRYAILTPDTVIALKRLNSTVLADGMYFTGKLNRQAIDRTATAIEKFIKIAREEDGAQEIFLFATEAVRSAKNGKKFTDEVKRRTGLKVDVISGKEEARIGFIGAAPKADALTGVFDIGGASCEIICGKGKDITFSASSPVGCVRLHDAALGIRQKAEELIASTLPPTLPKVNSLIGIGGTATALGAMLRCPDRYDPALVHGVTVDEQFLHKIAYAFFSGHNMAEEYPALTPNRAKVIGYGALAALEVLSRFGSDKFEVSERDNIEGYYFSKKYI